MKRFTVVGVFFEEYPVYFPDHIETCVLHLMAESKEEAKSAAERTENTDSDEKMWLKVIAVFEGHLENCLLEQE